MPTATLLRPRSLHFGGKHFLQGVPQPVNAEMAEQLKDNPRFTLSGVDGTPAVMQAGGRPHVRVQRLEAIRTAESTLDVDDEDAYVDVPGVGSFPSIDALEKVLGWRPDDNEVKEALKLGKAAKLGVGDVKALAATGTGRSPILTMSDTNARALDPDSEAGKQIQQQQDEVVASKAAAQASADAAGVHASATEDPPKKQSGIIRKGGLAKKTDDVDPTTKGGVTV